MALRNIRKLFSPFKDLVNLKWMLVDLGDLTAFRLRVVIIVSIN